MTKHIGRLQHIGLGKEITPGSLVPANVWCPVMAGALKPVFESANDESAYGVIDQNYDSQTVKNTSELSGVTGILRDNWIGYLLLGALGTEALCQCITLASISGGTPARGDAVSSATAGWTGVIEKIISINAVNYYFVSTTGGVLTTGQVDFTDGVYTATETIVTGVTGHMFKRLNTNNHPTFTMYGSSPVSDELSPYSMIGQMEIEVAVNDFAKFSLGMMGQQLQAAGPQSPVYTADNQFLAKHGNVYFAADEAALNAAAPSILQRVRFSINKNLTTVEKMGSTDVDSIHNQQFGVEGEIEAIYENDIYRDYVKNSTKQAMRVALINTEAAALNGNVYPSIYADFARNSFKEWDRSDDNDSLVSQTLGFTSEFSVAEAMTTEILLINSRSTAY